MTTTSMTISRTRTAYGYGTNFILFGNVEDPSYQGCKECNMRLDGDAKSCTRCYSDDLYVGQKWYSSSRFKSVEAAKAFAKRKGWPVKLDPSVEAPAPEAVSNDGLEEFRSYGGGTFVMIEDVSIEEHGRHHPEVAKILASKGWTRIGTCRRPKGRKLFEVLTFERGGKIHRSVREFTNSGSSREI